MPQRIRCFRIHTLAAALIAPAGIATNAAPAAPRVLSGARALESKDTCIALFAEAPLATYAGGVAGIAAAPRSGGGRIGERRDL